MFLSQNAFSVLLGALFTVMVGDSSQIEIRSKSGHVEVVITVISKFWAKYCRKVEYERSEGRLLYTTML